ncbi:hypothetical protein HDF11_005228 [Tunturiibacter psychrotolerans]
MRPDVLNGACRLQVLASHWIPVGEVDVDDTEVLDYQFDEAGMAVRLIAGESCANRLYRVTG